MIFKELVHLQTLNISHCDEVSDAGLTGMGIGNYKYVEKIQVAHNPEFTESRLRISLRSKAEEEIVRDADRKREIMKLCENVSKPLNSFSGYSLIRLKCLQELDLSGCNRITDVSLKHAFAFPELKILNLSQCQQVGVNQSNSILKIFIFIINHTFCYRLQILDWIIYQKIIRQLNT